jgi:ABC-type phosphate transport system substrate-binding protein
LWAGLLPAGNAAKKQLGDLGASLIAAFQTDFPNVTLDPDAKGSELGRRALLASEWDIAATSRPFSREELP